LRNILKQRQNFCQDISLRICVGTWNVNGGKKFRSIAYKGKVRVDHYHKILWYAILDARKVCTGKT